MKNKPYILQIAAGTTHGGASRIAVNLYEELKNQDYYSQIATGGEIPKDKDYLKIYKKSFVNSKNSWEKLFLSLGKKTNKYIGKIKGTGKLTNIFYNLGKPSCLIKNLRGVENFENFSGTHEFFKNLRPFPDIIHAHNLHGGYFDLHMLPYLSKKVPVILTLHDEWMFTGHCAYTFDCERWRTGCGKCPSLSLYQPLWRDTTKYNLKQKAAIYEKSNLHIITPSQWLMDRAKQSVLAPGIASGQVINNGLDLKTFKPGEKKAARAQLSLSKNSHIIIFPASKAKTNKFKDYPTLEKSLLSIAEKNTFTESILLLCIGEKSETIKKENIEIRFIDYVQNQEELVSYYQASDLLIHATKSDNFPTTILEAFACGIPVIGTDIGGIPEIIDKNTGLLYEKENYKDLASKIVLLLKNKSLRESMSKCANKKAKEKFGLQKQIDAHVNLYEKLFVQKITCTKNKRKFFL